MYIYSPNGCIWIKLIQTPLNIWCRNSINHNNKTLIPMKFIKKVFHKKWDIFSDVLAFYSLSMTWCQMQIILTTFSIMRKYEIRNHEVLRLGTLLQRKLRNRLLGKKYCFHVCLFIPWISIIWSFVIYRFLFKANPWYVFSVFCTFYGNRYTPPSKSLASLGAQTACQSIDTHFGMLTVHDNHKLGLFCHHKLIDVHELCIWWESQAQ